MMEDSNQHQAHLGLENHIDYHMQWTSLETMSNPENSAFCRCWRHKPRTFKKYYLANIIWTLKSPNFLLPRINFYKILSRRTKFPQISIDVKNLPSVSNIRTKSTSPFSTIVNCLILVEINAPIKIICYRKWTCISQSHWKYILYFPDKDGEYSDVLQAVRWALMPIIS